MLEVACLVSGGIKSPANDDRAAIGNKLVAEGTYAETFETACLAVVCDGVGGEAFGFEAAEIVTNIFSKLSGTQLTIDIINEYIVKANQAVISAQKKDLKHSKMATTIAGIYINGDDFIAFNVGDSRIYRYRNFISQISKDHSLWQEQIDLGLEPKQGQKGVITHFLGGSSAAPEIVDGKGRVFNNDVYIVCSDGVWGVLKDEEFENIISKYPVEEVCEKLVALALEKGSDDNLSVIIVRKV